MAALPRRAIMVGFVRTLCWPPIAIASHRNDRNPNQKQRREQKAKRRRRRSRLPDSATVTGSGPWISENFALRSGRYLVRADFTVANRFGAYFTADIYGPNGFTTLLLTTSVDAAGAYYATTIAQLPANGAYFVHVREADSAWTITFTPR